MSISDAPPEQRTLFIDRCAWSGLLGRALTAASIPFHHHAEFFEAACDDEVWLDGVAGKGWLVVTRDRRIRYKVNEQAAAVRAGLHLFVFAQGSIKAAQTAETLVRAYPAMLRASAAIAAPSFHSLHLDGGVSRLKIGGA